MNTDTPEKIKEDDIDPLASTPFRERALQEQKLKEELLQSATPAWRKRNLDRHADTLLWNPNEVKEYLRDLSSVLVSQGRNLTGFLTDQASTEHEANIDIKSSPSTEAPVSDPSLVQRPPNSITEMVFSRLEPTVQKPKIRKIDGFFIKDMEPSSVQEAHHSIKPSVPTTLRSSPVAEENGDVFRPEYDNFLEEQQIHDDLEPAYQEPAYQEPVYQEPAYQEPADTVESSNKIDLTRQVELDPLVGSPQSTQSSESDQSSVELRLESVDPLGLVHLKHCLNQFMNTNGIKLGEGSWRSLQDASVKLIETLLVQFTEEKSQKIILDRQNIFKTLEQYEIVPPGATNDDIFEMCCKYLPLESLNELELALFF